MNTARTTLGRPLLLSMLAACFCLWMSFAGRPEFCFTAGCALFENTTIAGVSMWVIGSVFFAGMAILALSGFTTAGRIVSTIALATDLVLLAILLFTAPCLTCLIVACFILLLYLSFRKAAFGSQDFSMGTPRRGRRPVLVYIWALLIILNIGTILRTETGVWSMTDISSHTNISIYFSPSCPACKIGVEKLSGRIDVAFYPVAEKEQDVARVAMMMKEYHAGASMAEALAASRSAKDLTFMETISPSMLLLRLRLLRNHAHVYLSGSTVIPYFELHGLPLAFLPQAKETKEEQSTSNNPSSQSTSAPFRTEHDGDPTMPDGLSIVGSCGGARNCDDESGELMQRR